MTKEEIYQNELKTLREYSKVEGNDKLSTLLLLKDYFSRITLWKKSLGISSTLIKSVDGQNLFLGFPFEITSQLVSYESILEDLEGTAFGGGYRNQSSFHAYAIINWKILKNIEDLKGYTSLPDPYVSLVLALKRGARVYVHNGDVLVSGRSLRVRVRPKDLSYRLPSLNEEFLDYIDEIQADFPNQENLNKLWEEFNSIK